MQVEIRSRNFSIVDFGVLVLAVLLLVTFLLVPLVTVDSGDDGSVTATGIEILFATPNGMESAITGIEFMLIAGVGALFCAIWAQVNRPARNFAAFMVMIFGFGGLIYFAHVVFDEHTRSIELLFGFYLALFATLGLILQVFIQRPDDPDVLPLGDFLVRGLQQARQEWLLTAVFLFMLFLPYIIGALTGSDPMPRRTGGAGESVQWQGIFIQVYIYAILAISYNLMFGFTGVVSFGHALFFGSGAYMLGIGIQHLGMDIGVAVVFTLLISAFLGLIMGLVSLRIKGVYFAIFTLAFAQVFFILAKNRLLVNITGAEDGLAFTAPEWIYKNATNRLTFYYITLVIFVLVFLFVRRLVNSPTGRVFQAIRENEDRARTIGLNTLQYKLLSIVFASTLASVAGMLHVIFNFKRALPDFLGATYTVDPLLSTLLGGTGTFTGPALGSAVLHLGEKALQNSSIMIGDKSVGDYWLLLLGIAFIIVVMIFPQGIVGTFYNWRAKRKARRSQAALLQDSPAAGE